MRLKYEPASEPGASPATGVRIEGLGKGSCMRLKFETAGTGGFRCFRVPEVLEGSYLRRIDLSITQL